MEAISFCAGEREKEAWIEQGITDCLSESLSRAAGS